MNNSTNGVNYSYVDPLEPAEAATIAIVTSLFVLLQGPLLIYVALNRNYPPLRAKQLHLMYASVFASGVWLLGSLTTYRVIPQAGHPAFLLCDFWSVWICLVFGAYLYSSLYTFRFWRLYAIVKLNINVSSTLFNLSFFILWGPTILYGIFSSAMKIDGPEVTHGLYECNFTPYAVYINIAIFAVYLVCLCFFGIALRGIKQRYLNEYREIFAVCAILIVTFILVSVLVKLNLQFYLWGRILCTFLIFIIVMSPSFIFLLYPAYQCYFHHDEYLHKFRNFLQDISAKPSKDESKDRPSILLSEVAESMSRNPSHVLVEEKKDADP